MRHTITFYLRRCAGLRVYLKPFCVACLCLLFLTGAAVLGQSGRKQKQVEKQPPVQGINQPEARVTPEPTETPEKPKEKGPIILVMTEMPDMNIPLYYVDIARQSCLQELRGEMPSLELKEEPNKTRSDAIKAAKGDERTNVVLMEMRIDSMNSAGFDLRYTIFEAKTGKIAGTGSGYPMQSNGSSAPPVGASRAQMMVEWAGRDVARQVLKKLKLKI